MFTYASSSAAPHQDFRAIDIRADGDLELLETKSGRRSVKSADAHADVHADAFLTRLSCDHDDDVRGETLGRAVYHLAMPGLKPVAEARLTAPLVARSLISQPQEVLEKIADFLPYQDIPNLALVCKEFQNTLKAPQSRKISVQLGSPLAKSLFEANNNQIISLLKQRFGSLSRIDMARLATRGQRCNQLEARYAAAVAEHGLRDQKAAAENGGTPVSIARAASLVVKFGGIFGMSAFGGAVINYKNWIFFSLLPSMGLEALAVFPASQAFEELDPELVALEPYQTALGIAASLLGSVATAKICQIASTDAQSNEVDLYGSIAILGCTLLSGLTHVHAARYGLRAYQAKSAAETVAQRLALARAEMVPIPIGYGLSTNVTKVGARISITIEAM